eukprot:1147770-Pelagomonas_calceolata.AAC.1
MAAVCHHQLAEQVSLSAMYITSASLQKPLGWACRLGSFNSGPDNLSNYLNPYIRSGLTQEIHTFRRLYVLVEGISEWCVKNPGKVAKPEFINIQDLSVFEGEEDKDKQVDCTYLLCIDETHIRYTTSVVAAAAAAAAAACVSGNF